MACRTYLKLLGGFKMPILGFGTWQATDEELERALDNALSAGYRHIDTAAAYENEHVIGRILSRWMNDGRLKRDDLFICTKLPPSGLRPESVEKFLKKSLEDLQLDYVDLYLVHTPFAFKDIPGILHPFDDKGEIMLDTPTDHLAVWKEMEAQVKAGRARSIGVSNFNKRQLQRLIDSKPEVPISNLQIELHVYLQQRELVDFCKEHDITVTAYSPLGSRGISNLLAAMGIQRDIPDLLSNPVVQKIGEKHSKTAAQVLLRYTVQRNIAAIPKSTNAARLKQNISIFDFELDADDVAALGSLDEKGAVRICDFSFFKGLKNHPEFPF